MAISLYANCISFNNYDDILYIIENVVLIICLKCINIDLYIFFSNVHAINTLHS